MTGIFREACFFTLRLTLAAGRVPARLGGVYSPRTAEAQLKRYPPTPSMPCCRERAFAPARRSLRLEITLLAPKSYAKPVLVPVAYCSIIYG